MTTRLADPMACLAQADLLLLLAQMLKTPTTWSDADRRVSDEDIAALAESSGLGRLPQAAGLLQKAVDEWQLLDGETASAEYSRLFEGSLACPPNETMYVRRDKGAILADIAGFYRAFGFELADDFREKHDHILAETQFVAMLLVLVGRAAVVEHAEEQDVAQSALTGFLNDHLGAWIGSFAERLEASASLPFYSTVSLTLAAAWTTLRADQGLTEPDEHPGPLGEETGTPYECGLCPAAAEGEGVP